MENPIPRKNRIEIWRGRKIRRKVDYSAAEQILPLLHSPISQRKIKFKNNQIRKQQGVSKGRDKAKYGGKDDPG
jgi:hypothetical protein